MKKDTTFSIRISSDDLDTIRRKAKKARMSQSDYVIRCCLVLTSISRPSKYSASFNAAA